MSYQTLEQRFLAKSSEIYNRFSNTSATNPEIKPDSRASKSQIKDDSRSVPRVSTLRDKSRIFNFLKSRDGVLFLSKQLLLQTGNTFAETRLFNPLEIGLNGIPFLHVTRHLGRPIGNLSTPTRDNRGALQQETIDNLRVSDSNIFTKYIQSRATQLLNAAVGPFKALLTSPKKTSDGQFYIRPEDDTNWYPRLLEPQPLGSRGSKWQRKEYRVVTDLVKQNVQLSTTNTLDLYPIKKLALLPTNLVGGTIDSTYISFLTKNKNAYSLDIGASKFTTYDTDNNNFYTMNAYSNRHTVNIPNGVTDIYNAWAKYTTQQADNGELFSKLESTTDGVVSFPTVGNGYFYGPVFSKALGNSNGEDISVIAGSSTKKIFDTYNVTPKSTAKELSTQLTELNSGLVSYDTILGVKPAKSDIIKFIFKSNEKDAQPIHFRAFISTIKETVKPEYSEQRYIGRTERFVTYAGARRTVNLEFNIVALSKFELDNMWLRINYLTGLAFPKDASTSGFMVPPLFKITVGGIYEDQPCYVDNLDYDLLDDKITFDIDSEVSQVINVRLSLVLLEKRSKFYNSPFYKVVETIQAAQLQSAQSATPATAQATAEVAPAAVNAAPAATADTNAPPSDPPASAPAPAPSQPAASTTATAPVQVRTATPPTTATAPAATPAPATRPAIRQPSDATVVNSAQRQEAEVAARVQQARRVAKSNPELEAYISRLRAPTDSTGVASTKLGTFPLR